ncbi:MAG TPA: T9SS type A sorting domain-containing protein [Flavipsychrobacter sp.]|nr:T9SS type A sorting domain-containing protein [Flavipsychrobacter sp.]
MKPNIFRVLALLCLPLATQAQPIITSSDYSPVAGETFLIGICSPMGISPSSLGAGVIWDFSSLAITFTGSTHYISCSATPFCSLFPGSTTAGYSIPTSGTVTDTTFIYYINSDTAFERIGFCHVGDTTTYITGVDILKYPFNYNDSKQDTFYGIRNSNIAGLDIKERILQRLTYDAYGTLKLPTGTYTNVARLHRYIVSQDSSVALGSYFTVDSSEQYEWYIAGYHNPILSIAVLGDSTIGVSYSERAAEGVDNVSATATTINVYPIPAHDKLNVQYQAGNAPVQIWLTDMSGKILLQNTGRSGTGNNVTTLNTGMFAPGIYLLRVYTGNEVVVKKVIIE